MQTRYLLGLYAASLGEACARWCRCVFGRFVRIICCPMDGIFIGVAHACSCDNAARNARAFALFSCADDVFPYDECTSSCMSWLHVVFIFALAIFDAAPMRCVIACACTCSVVGDAATVEHATALDEMHDTS